MANNVIILGKSGTGKSTSIRGLDPKETVVINTLKKRLPFKGSGAMYCKENHNILEVNTYDNVIAYLKAIDDKMPNIKNVVLDDIIYIMRKEFFTRAKEVGYGKFTDLAAHFQQIISTCENMREDINVFFIMHSEDVVSDNITTSYKVSTVGKLLDSQYNPVEVVPMVLYSAIKYDEKGTPTYGFYTHSVKEGSVEIPAKSPADMFDSDFIPNDLGFVVKCMNEYYNG